MINVGKINIMLTLSTQAFARRYSRGKEQKES